MKKVIFFILFLILECNGPSPLNEGKKRENLYPNYFFVSSISTTSAQINWKCNAKTRGTLLWGLGNLNQTQITVYENDFHYIILNNLSPNTAYQYQVFCGEIKLSTFNILLNRIIPQRFVTNNLTPPFLRALQRGIWILGGIGADSQPVAQVDLFDPVDNVVYPRVTSIPTPRAYAQIVSHKGKIYVIGGMTKTLTFAQSQVVEEYDPIRNSWATKTPMTSPLQGGIVGSIGEEIVVFAGTTTTDMTTGTILNTIYKFKPDLGTNGVGVWAPSQVSANAIFARIDMASCAIQGVIFFTGGRLFSDGSLFATTDAYVTASNATTSLIEASNSLNRFGTASACYRPISTDPFPSDQGGIILAGGSTLPNITTQPPSAITASDRYEFMQIGNSTNAFMNGPILPVPLYAPSMEVSYEKRRVYLFGGASVINLPTDTIYSFDLANPIAGPWVLETIALPVARFGHKAVIINR